MKNCILLLPALFALASACNKTSFGGTSVAAKKAPASGAELPTDHELQLTCKDGIATMPTELAGIAPYRVTVKGNFCDVPTAVTGGAPTVIFMIDVSGSMAQNDPPQDGSCGRLAAAQAILLSQGSANGANLGFVSFADYVENTQVPIPWTDFKDKLDAKTFCDMKGGATNYQAALTRVYELLKSASGPKVIYFISDGLPTRAGENPSNPVTDGLVGSILIETIQKAGLTAASALRNNLKDLFFYAVYLDGGDGQATAEGDGIIGNAKDYLAAITGSPQAVRLVNRAQDLADVIMSFNPAFKPTTSTGLTLPRLSALAGNKVVDLQSVQPDAADPSHLAYITAPIILEGSVGQTSTTTVTVEMTLADGTKKQQSVDLRFTPKAP